MPNLKYKLTSPLLMWTIVIVGGAVLWKILPHGQVFVRGQWGIAVLVLGVLNWAYITFHAMRVHKHAPSSVHNIDELVTEGAYSVVRHPMYVADVILAWCAFVYWPSYHVFAVALWLTLVLFFWSLLEERMLEDKFLEDYRAYKSRVPMFIPGRWK